MASPQRLSGVLVVIVVVCIATPAILVTAQVIRLSSLVSYQQQEIRDLSDRSEQQGDTLVANGLPRDGTAGKNGASGQDGAPGADGRDGADGRNGVSVQGPQGRPGVAGTDGQDGQDGANGQNGADGRDGEPSTVPGPQGPQGEPGVQGPTGEAGPAPVAIQVPDGQGGFCLAADPDGDLVYACEPEV